MKKRTASLLGLLLIVSLAANGWFIWRHFHPARRTTSPQFYLDADTFDFSKTGLSDESFKLNPEPLPKFDPDAASAEPPTSLPHFTAPELEVPRLSDLPPSTEAPQSSPPK